MNISLEHDEHPEFPIYHMTDNNNDGLPIYIRRYDQTDMTTVLHGHDSIQINYIVHGSLSHIINNSSHDLVKGDIFVIPPFVPHRLKFRDNCDCEVIELEFTSIANLAIVPMQDYLELSNDEGRMNTPSTAEVNWAWRISPRYNTAKLRAKMLALVEKTGRAK